MALTPDSVIDAHFHLGLVGDQHPKWGHISDHFRSQIQYRIFLAYARLGSQRPTDNDMIDATIRVISESSLDGVVGLCLDAVHDEDGTPRPDRTHLWVSNDYGCWLRDTHLPRKLLHGASVHPYALDFTDRVRREVDRGAVLLKWLPSAQAIDLADPRVATALRDLTRLGANGNPLPLLLHCGGEYAVPPAEDSTSSFDFLSWSSWDAFWNLFRGQRRWKTPRASQALANLRAAVGEGAVVILAHCGLPYFAPHGLTPALEHSDFKVVQRLLTAPPPSSATSGRFFADVSACCTPFRRSYFPNLNQLPEGRLLLGSDFPTPVFELSSDTGEMLADLRAALSGDLNRLIIPQDNLLDVNVRELGNALGETHPMFTNFARLLTELELPAAHP